jgi:hypothetical protein
MTSKLSEKRKAQMRAYSNARYKRTRKLVGRSRRGVECREYYRAWRVNAGACMDCGFVITSQNYYLIDADHRPEHQKLFMLSKCHKETLSKTIAELAKCDPVCCRCHRIRTFERANATGKKGWETRRKTKEQLVLQLQ